MPVRVIEPHAVRHPETGAYIVPNPALPYADDDPLVLAYPWLFAADDDDAERGVERAVAHPGYRRPAKRLR